LKHIILGYENQVGGVVVQREINSNPSRDMIQGVITTIGEGNNIDN
jgi:hypothetical protein